MWTTDGSSDRKKRLPPDWRALRALTLERCGGRCEVVKKSGKRCWDAATEVDHIEPGDNHALSNLRGICRWHHARKTSQEGARAQAEKRSILTRPAETHPGVFAHPKPPPKHRGF